MIAFFALFLMAVFFVLLGYVDIVSRRFYKSVTGESKSPVFYKRMKFIKNFSPANEVEKQVRHRVLAVYKACFVIAVILFSLYVIGNILK